MKQLLVKHFAIAALALCAVPSTLLAQDKDKAKDKSNRQQIVITRTGDKEDKMTIEIDGDKVKVNGKDVADMKDIQVHVNNLKTANALAFRSPGTFNMTWDDNGAKLFSIDSNRAMLGVVTEGADKGAEVQSITKESAAEKAGLKKGDVITKIDNKKIDATDDVSEAVHAHKPGEKVSITYLRDGKEQKTTAELGRWKGMDLKTMVAPKIFSTDAWSNGNQNSRTFERSIPGMAYTTTYDRRKLGLSVQDTDDNKGVKVLDVEDESMASKAGIKEGDVITMVDDKAVNSADDIAKVMREKREQPTVKMQLNRGGKTQTVEVRVKKPKTVDL